MVPPVFGSPRIRRHLSAFASLGQVMDESVREYCGGCGLYGYVSLERSRRGWTCDCGAEHGGTEYTALGCLPCGHPPGGGDCDVECGYAGD